MFVALNPPEKVRNERGLRDNFAELFQHRFQHRFTYDIEICKLIAKMCIIIRMRAINDEIKNKRFQKDMFKKCAKTPRGKMKVAQLSN